METQDRNDKYRHTEREGFHDSSNNFQSIVLDKMIKAFYLLFSLQFKQMASLLATPSLCYYIYYVIYIYIFRPSYSL